LLCVVAAQHLRTVEIPVCETQTLVQQDLRTCSPELCTSTTDDLTCPQSGQSATADDPQSVTFRGTDLDDLPCWIGCIQLDHPYDSHRSTSGSSNSQTLPQPPLYCHHEVTETANSSDADSCNKSVDPQCRRELTDVRNSWVGLLDHAYETSSWDSESTGDHGRWDHSYNIQCSADRSASIDRSVSGQHLDHSYDTRMSSELSYSETILSSFLDHAYVASDWVVTSGRRYACGQWWSSSDDLRTLGRTAASFLW